jgi:hypothetical protein
MSIKLLCIALILVGFAEALAESTPRIANAGPTERFDKYALDGGGGE